MQVQIKMDAKKSKAVMEFLIFTRINLYLKVKVQDVHIDFMALCTSRACTVQLYAHANSCVMLASIQHLSTCCLCSVTWF